MEKSEYSQLPRSEATNVNDLESQTFNEAERPRGCFAWVHSMIDYFTDRRTGQIELPEDEAIPSGEGDPEKQQTDRETQRVTEDARKAKRKAAGERTLYDMTVLEIL